ncbi:OLC1v1016134C1 [Oldenlandia corymbosa var. corymbosa]|uniref:OLC1v1016134C1 n=1 Tax=Oldenlandia corymbosa var. corymbosa TaxID=529605 RepID=A0AAV1E6J7_OLDCO|nr:OLC1v1016134C1 [Oldenlandia corymbosa var. corymbosa]
MAAAEYNTSSAGGRNSSNTHILEELEALSQSLYHSHTTTSSIGALTTNRRTASLVLPRTSIPPLSSVNDGVAVASEGKQLNPKPRSRRMSLSPWRSRPSSTTQDEDNDTVLRKDNQVKKSLQDAKVSADEKKGGIWNWKPIRALAHIGMQKLSCLFSVEVVTVQGLPASMNGLRLSVCVRKKESKDGAVQTMPSRVQQGAADFEETLFIRCHVYYTPASGTQLMKFEPRPFLVYVFAVDAMELDFGRSSVDVSQMIQESIEKSHEGARVRQWDTSFNLSGKAKGGELVLKLGFQIMEKDGGVGIYTQAEGQKSAKAGKLATSSMGRKQSKFSFSVPSPRLSSRAEAWTPSQTGGKTDLQDIDDLNLDDDEPPLPPVQPQPPQKSQVPDAKLEDDLPDFEVEDKGVEIQVSDKTIEEEKGEESSEENLEKKSVSSEVVKEIVHEQVHLTRLTELDSIAQQIKALESLMREEKSDTHDDESESQKLDADEETVTREFLQLLEDSERNEFKLESHDDMPQLKLEGEENHQEAETNAVYIPDLGKGLGCVVQTRNGGYLAALNPLDTEISRKETPKLAMQISRPMILQSKATNGFDQFQRMAALGLEGLGSEILSLMPLEELKGKTAEQIAFEGIASAIIQGRNKEGANSSAARSIASVKAMVTAMNTGRKERISTGIWNLTEDPLTVVEVLASSMQKLEAMAVEALKIQADIAEEEAPFDVSPLLIKGQENTHLLASAIPIEEWINGKALKSSTDDDDGDSAGITISVVVQLRDPQRQYEAVGSPMIALIYASCVDIKPGKYEEEKLFKVASLHVGGIKARDDGEKKKNQWDSQKQRLTAMQWLVAYGLGKAGKRGKRRVSITQDFLWSISSRVMADMWLKAIRNPDVKFTK